ncbi:avidin/streptavidin family protein [Marinomonas sp. C2222]|uniref:Avidin/streptavidin family protein n=1 Tax=Marinomonas sargassi TaxID=2984494 RepID=A0ABT2YRM2_9GAMM|nr:avidin/streptavidin family protein [Marinomonas sargassi]MCV2402538.1 avidin/streptavidin family protein [Marinomonas sargassi]
MSLQINGTWVNSYGSVLKIQADESGQIIGEYSSTTGSSGTYYLVGYCRPDDPTKELGQGIVLSIFWRAIEGKDPDNSWHWVSTYCGQLQSDGTLSVINSLVATIEFAGFSTGAYIDKLAFTQENKSIPKLSAALPNNINEANHPRIGSWLDPISGAELSLSTPDQKTGYISGTLLYQGESISMNGFTDTYASDDGLSLQSLSLSGYLSSSDTPISLSGQLLIEDNKLQLTCWNANSTSPADSYFQAKALNWLLNKVDE